MRQRRMVCRELIGALSLSSKKPLLDGSLIKQRLFYTIVDSD
jgi:hypothetical protein